MSSSSSSSSFSSLPLHLSNRPHKPLLFRPSLPFLSTTSNNNNNNHKNRYHSVTSITCRVSDEFPFPTATNSFYREFSVVGNMLKKIEPLDVSLISKGASDTVKDSMRRMVSSMLGLLPSDQFAIKVTVSKRPLVRLLASSLITGYTLWNAEYRIMLMKNFERSGLTMCGGIDDTKDTSEVKDVVCDDRVEMEYCCEELERLDMKNRLGDLSTDAMSYIRELESELSAAEKDLNTQKQESLQIGRATGGNNDILKYLRSLDTDMLDELSRPSSSEVKGILQQLVQCTSRRVFKEDITPGLIEDFCETRDYLVKLLFWCMLLGHQLRGLENTLYLRCAVGFS